MKVMGSAMELNDALLDGYANEAPATLAEVLGRADLTTVLRVVAELDEHLLTRVFAHADIWLLRRTLPSLDPALRERVALALADGRHAVPVLRQLGEGEREAVLQRLQPALAKRLRRLVGLEADAVGTWCTTDLAIAAPNEHLRDVLARLGRDHVERIPGIWVVAEDGRYVGYLSAWQALQASPGATIETLATGGQTIVLDVSLERALAEYDWSRPEGHPVIDGDGHLVGVLTLAALHEGLGRTRSPGLSPPPPVLGPLLAAWMNALRMLSAGRP